MSARPISLAVTDRAKDVRFGASPDDLVAETVQAAAPLVVAAELRDRATELDPAGGERP